MKRKIENYLNSKDKNEYTNLDRIFELYLSGDIKKLLSKYAGVGIYPTINKLGKTIQLNYNYHNIYVNVDFFEDKYNIVVYHVGINAEDLENLFIDYEYPDDFNLEKLIKEVDEKIKKQDQKALFDFFKAAKIGRDSLGPEKLGAIPGFYDLFINLADKVGSLADVTQILAEARINLVNVHILEIREEIDGIAQLTFSSEKDRQKALGLLKTKYKIIER